MSNHSIENETDHENEKVDVVMSQTNYTRAEAEQLLARYNNDEVAVIRRYLGGPNGSGEVKAKPQSTNQLVYSEIRKFMDACVKDLVSTVSETEAV